MLPSRFEYLIWLMVLPLASPSIMSSSSADSPASSWLQYLPGIQLSRPLPKKLLQNQILQISGKVTKQGFFPIEGAYFLQILLNFTEIDNPQNTYSCFDSFQDISKQFGYSGDHAAAQQNQNQKENQKEGQFQLSCRIQQVGMFFISVVVDAYDLDNQIEGKLFKIKLPTFFEIVKKDNFKLPTTPSPHIPQGLKITLTPENSILVNWTSKAPLTNLTFYQPSSGSGDPVTVQFLLSSYSTSYSPDFFQFRFFENGKTFVQISHAASSDGTLLGITDGWGYRKVLAINAVQHQQQFNSPTLFKADPPLVNLLMAGDKYKGVLTFKQEVPATCLLQNLNRNIYKIQEIYLRKPKSEQQTIFKKNTPVPVQIVFPSQGSYILQCSTTSRQVFIHNPFYVSSNSSQTSQQMILPLLPNYFDLYNYFFSNNNKDILTLQSLFLQKYHTNGHKYIQPPFDVKNVPLKRGILIELMNWERRNFGVPELKQDEILNQVAQSHCQDMLKNNYIDLNDKQGTSLIAKVVLRGISTRIRSFLMDSTTVIGTHLDNFKAIKKTFIIASDYLTRIGVGIVEAKKDQNNTDQHYLVTYLFTSRDLVGEGDGLAEELSAFRQRVVNQILKVNEQAKLEEDGAVTAAIDEWGRAEGTKSLRELEALLEAKFGEGVTVNQKHMYLASSEVENIKNDYRFTNLQGTKLGFSLRINKESQTSMTAYIASY